MMDVQRKLRRTIGNQIIFRVTLTNKNVDIYLTAYVVKAYTVCYRTAKERIDIINEI